MKVHIHAPQPEIVEIKWVPCPTCICRKGKRKSPMVLALYAWYGTDWTCLRCGERWAEDEMLERPFAPAWRKANIEAAKKLWRSKHGLRKLGGKA